MPALLTGPGCPSDGFGEAGSCYRLSQAASCPAGAETTSLGFCRVEVDDVVGIVYCEDPAGVLQGSFCQETVPALLARTGSETTAQLFVGLLAVGTGASLVGAARTRRLR